VAVPAIAMQREQDYRCPVVGQHLEVRQLLGAVRRQHERESTDQPGVVAPGELACEEERAESAERKRQRKHHVVRGHRIMGDGLHDPRHWQQRQQAFRQRDRVGHREEHGSVPPGCRQRDGSRAVPEDPGVEERIAGIVRKSRSEPAKQREQQRNRKCTVNCRHPEAASHRVREVYTPTHCSA